MTLKLIVILYLASRLTNLLGAPIFTDEAIYLRWSQIMSHDFSQLFLPLSDGKTPLFMWLTLPLLKIPTDPLLAGRLISVVSGLFTLLGLYKICSLLWSKKVGWVCSLLYVSSPIALTYDRLALVESLLICNLTWALYYTWKLRKFGRNLDLAILAGLVWMSVLTKPVALFFIPILFLTTFPQISKKSSKSSRFFLKLLLTVALALLGFLLLKKSAYFYRIFLRSSDYSFTFKEILSNPFRQTFEVMKTIWEWSQNGFTRIVWFFFLGVSLYSLLKKSRPVTFFLLSFTFLFFLHGLTGKVIYPRYFLIFLPFILPITAFGLVSLPKNGRNTLILLVILLLPSISYDYFLIFNFRNAPLVKLDKWQYLSSWASGIGIKESVDFFRKEALNQPITILTEGSFGNPLDGLSLYLSDPKLYLIIPIGQPVFSLEDKYYQDSKQRKSFLVVNQSRVAFPDEPKLLKVREFPKEPLDGKTDSLIIYQFKP